MPGYLRQFEKAAETANRANVLAERLVNVLNMSQILYIDDGKIKFKNRKGFSTNDGGASSAMDWEQEIRSQWHKRQHEEQRRLKRMDIRV